MTGQIDGFLQAAGWGAATRAPLAGDASNRTYLRLTQPDGRPGVLMIAPPEKGEDIRPFVTVTGHLRDLDLSAPAILAQDPDTGLLLLEDLGDALYVRVCAANPRSEDKLYAAAVDLLAEVCRHPAPADLPPYDAATYLREAQLLTGWYLPAATTAPVAGSVSDHFDQLIGEACAALDTANPVMVLRDYHAENLLWLPDRGDLARVGLLDYQDALAGHPAYDLVSLLEDARRDTSQEMQQAMLSRFVAATGADDATFRRAYATLGAQRNLKIIGIFARLWLRDGKPQYLAHIPRVWAHLMRDLSHPALAELRDWVMRHVPPPEAVTLDRLRSASDAA